MTVVVFMIMASLWIVWYIIKGASSRMPPGRGAG